MPGVAGAGPHEERRPFHPQCTRRQAVLSPPFSYPAFQTGRSPLGGVQRGVLWQPVLPGRACVSASIRAGRRHAAGIVEGTGRLGGALIDSVAGFILNVFSQ